MKLIIKLVLVLFFIGFMSCRDTKKEEAETQAALEQIEAVEAEVKEISEEVDQKVEELEETIKELDSI